MSVALQIRPHNRSPANVRCTVVTETWWCRTLQHSTGCTTCSVSYRSPQSNARRRMPPSLLEYWYLSIPVCSLIVWCVAQLSMPFQVLDHCDTVPGNTVLTTSMSSVRMYHTGLRSMQPYIIVVISSTSSVYQRMVNFCFARSQIYLNRAPLNRLSILLLHLSLCVL